MTLMPLRTISAPPRLIARVMVPDSKLAREVIPQKAILNLT
jgi:hypothetical protein